MAKAAPKKTSTPRAKSKSATENGIDKVGEEALNKLKALGIEEQLQAEIQWCLGSYRHDQNPSGLKKKIADALEVFKTEKEKNTKGITSKLIKDIEKSIAD